MIPLLQKKQYLPLYTDTEQTSLCLVYFFCNKIEKNKKRLLQNKSFAFIISVYRFHCFYVLW